VGSRATKVIFRWVGGRRCWLEAAPGCDCADCRWIAEFNENFEAEPPLVRQWFFVLGTWRGHAFAVVDRREGI